MNITKSSVGVQIPEPEEKNNAIKRHEAFVKGGSSEQACVIKASADQLVCTISGLSPAHDYTVGMRTCVFGSNGYGPDLEKSFRTL